MLQKFAAREKKVMPDGAIAWAPGGPMDCIGYRAKIQNCQVVIGFGEDQVAAARLTCYATGYADTFFSVPAATRYKGRYIKGYFTGDSLQNEDGEWEAITVFRVVDRYKHLFKA